jgi:hypothetical protein
LECTIEKKDIDIEIEGSDVKVGMFLLSIEIDWSIYTNLDQRTVNITSYGPKKVEFIEQD